MFNFINNVPVAVAMLIVMLLIINKFSGKLGDALHILGLKLKMPDSVRGATLDAVASSFPEFATAMIAVFVGSFDEVGIPTIAGSGVFNVVIIPMASILAYKGSSKINIDKKGVMRSAVFYTLSLLLLLFFGLRSHYSLFGGLTLISLYIIYVIYINTKTKKEKIVPENLKDVENSMSYFEIFLWTAAGIAAIWIGIDAVVKSVLVISDAINVRPFIVSVIILASATSIPDTILSVKSAKRGDMDGAVSNAVGSNIFNICMCLGLPMVIYYFINGENLPSDLSNNVGMIYFLIISMIITLIILIKKSGIKRKDAHILIATYSVFILYIINLVVGIV